MSSASSTHRPAVQVTMAAPTRVRSLLQKASDLELRLQQEPPQGALPSNNKSSASSAAASTHIEKEKQRLRSLLCETLSDILLTDPVVAMHKDCCGRLWRTCFYSEIGTFRNLIHREKRKQGPALAPYERALQKFLSEAMQLYQFLITHYQDRLLVAVANNSSMTMSTTMPTPTNTCLSQETVATMDDSQEDTSAATTAAIVEGLHRLLIHLGDLHRYAGNYTKSEACYGKAAKLAPGKGNPYNQLAVVAQLRDPSSPLNCVALYWYVRSLLATDEPFTTSLDNMKRLLEGNRQLLLKMNKNTTTTQHQKQDLEQASSNTKTWVNVANSKKAMQEALRAQKAAASKLFLTQFVDFHYELFTRIMVTSASNGHLQDGDYDSGQMQDMMLKMEQLIESFQATLQNAAFGDALLCKMVTINAFSVTWPKRGGRSEAPTAPQPHLDKQQQQQPAVALSNQRLAIMGMAYFFLLSFGATIAERLEEVLGKVLESSDRHKLGPEGSGSGGVAIPSVRLLMSLTLIVNFVCTMPADDNPQVLLSTTTSLPTMQKLTETVTKSLVSFWQKVARLASLLAPLDKRVRSHNKINGKANGNVECEIVLPEMKLLRGFAPFQSFTSISRKEHDNSGEQSVQLMNDDDDDDDQINNNYNQNGASATTSGGFVSAAEAVEALDLSGGATAMSSTQDSVASGGSSSTAGSPEENKGKVAYFLQVIQQIVNDGTSSSLFYPKLIRDKRGIYKVLKRPLHDLQSERIKQSSQSSQDGNRQSTTTTNDLNAGSQAVDKAESITNDYADDGDNMEIAAAENEPEDDGTTALPAEHDDDDNDENNDVNMTSLADDGGGDVLVYKAPEGGEGPALLVPGALLLNLVKDTTDNTTTTTSNDVPKGAAPPVPTSKPRSVAEPRNVVAPTNSVAPTSHSKFFVPAAPTTIMNGGTPCTGIAQQQPLPPSPKLALDSMDVVVDEKPTSTLNPDAASVTTPASLALSPPRPPPGFGGFATNDTAALIPFASRAITTTTTTNGATLIAGAGATLQPRATSLTELQMQQPPASGFNAHHQQQPPPPPPPPPPPLGFNGHQKQQQQPLTSFNNYQQQHQHQPLTTSNGYPQQYQNQQVSYGISPHAFTGTGDFVDRHRTVGDSFPFFGFPSQPPMMANPFFASSPMGFLPSAGGGAGGASVLGPSYESSSFTASFLDTDMMVTGTSTATTTTTGSSDGTSLLDSSLLSSLWMDDTGSQKQKNPFAAT